MAAPAVFIIGSDADYDRMFKNAGWLLVDRISKADLVQFTGGSDVDPSLYGQRPHPTAYIDPRRDVFEAAVFQASVNAAKPLAGICRGGQFLNVMNGGSMWQDVDGHCNGQLHVARDNLTQSELFVSSTHHQMMRPNTEVAEILMTAKMSHRKEAMLPSGQPFTRYSDELDIEACFYGSTNSLCFQPHPEFMRSDLKACRECYFNYIEYHFGLKGAAE
jgi:gamma-glutamyl-gamma-aminobutyrate hydrolase PuuD